MKIMYHISYFRLGLAACLWIISTTSRAQLIINEFMQSNIDGIIDDLNEYPDSWVEIYNPSSSPVNLGSFSLGVKNTADKAHRLPPRSIPAHGYFIIFCDKEGIDLHTNFRLESGKGGEIYLFKDKEIVDCIIDIKKMAAPNISYGREIDGGEMWGYQIIPTPGTANVSGITSYILPDPIFNIPGGIKTSPIEVSMLIPADVPQGTVIRYTTDCSEPTVESKIYTEPIQISSTTIIRAKLFCEGTLSPRAVTHSYIYHHADMTLPIVSIVTDSLNLYDETIGILADGTPDVSYKNWEYDWRRPINFEYFISGDTTSSVNQLCETRLKGSTSRYYPIKSMVIYANKRFGEKRLETEFFPTQRPGVTDFKSIELRNAGQDFYRMYMRDALVQSTMGENVDIDWQAYQPAVVYLNGKYHALLNIRERANEDNIYTHYDGLEDIVMIENFEEVKEGSIDKFVAFKNFYSEEGHTYEEYCQQIDMDEFINYFIMQVYFANCDFPGNNNIMWRPTEEGGKWRWLAKDLDTTLGFITKYDFAYFDWLYNPEIYPDFNWANNQETTLLFRRLLSIPEFLEDFLSHIAIYMGDFMQADKIISRLEQMADIIKDEHSINFEKNVITGVPFDTAIEITKNHIRKRNDFLYQHIADFFNHGNPIPVVIKCYDESVKTLSLNDITLSDTAFNGALYPSTHLTLKILSDDGEYHYQIQLIVTNNEGAVTTTLSQSSDQLIFQIPSEGNVEIIITPRSSGVPEMSSNPNIDFDRPYEIYSLDGAKLIGKNVSNIPRGIFIIRQGTVAIKYCN